MSEVNTPRLMAAAKEFNIGASTLIDFLVSKNLSGSDDLKPTSKLTEEMYRVLQGEYQQDKTAKEKADKVELVKSNAGDAKKKKDEQDLSFKKKEEKPKAAEPVAPAAAPVEAPTKEKEAPIVEAPIPVVEAPVVIPVPEVIVPVVPVAEVPLPEVTKAAAEVPATPKETIVKIEAPELEGPKILDKIDLDAIDFSTRPKKGAVAKKKETPKEEVPAKPAAPKAAAPTPTAPVVEPPVAAPAEVAPSTPVEAVDNTPVIENIQTARLTGPKILGKIELPVDNDTRPKRDDANKRKRIPIQKKPGVPGIDNRGGNPNARPGDNRPGMQQGGGARGPQQGGAAGGNRPQQGQGGGARGPQQGGNRFQRPGNNNNTAPRREDKIIDAKEIQEKLKQTQAKLAGAGGRGKSLKAKYRKEKRDQFNEAQSNRTDESNKLQVTEFISVSELAGLMEVSFADIISKCMNLGIMVSINQRLEADVIELVASEFDYEVEFIGVDDAAELEVDEEEDDPANLKPRAPIVTIMGHVDHGKTSLLDYIRNTNVIAGEAGGITQHIGAYEVTLPSGRAITFLDTPGHEAFTAMRARGAKVTDIAVIVVAADDAVMPQTKEAISHAQAANVPMIFAINKVDKDGADPERIKQQLASMNILVESWGGKYQSQEISAKKGMNIDLLLEKILLETDILELTANAEKQASGTIIEASLDKGRGYVATILVQNGTLRQGDMIVSGQFFGKVKAMYNERNQRIDIAPPSTPVLILGLNGAPQAGETFKVFADESDARENAYKRGQILREQGMRAKKHITLDEIGRRLALGNFKELNVIIKGDVDGSVEALSDSLQKLSTEEIVVKVIHKAVGAITENDVNLAAGSDAIIIGFNVRPSMQAARLAENESIEIKMYSIIYNAIEEIKSAMEGMLEPTVEEKILGNVEIRETYKFDKATVAGCFVLDGKMARNNRIRLVREGIVIYTGELGSLKRYRDDAKEVSSGMECGLVIRNYNDIKVGDIVEAFEEVEVKRTL
ncbi:translation initiation factor IF-2 [Ferruginibacter yonginensis]|uniref:Translation initiation factor IF-2 n=1 Tax=Ferruginibacter yonginensis TaxID=1310416 RepID=A0ABV8QU48_9BACT